MNKGHFYVLDFLKVISIFIIVMWHSALFKGILHSGYLAVELFFIISGFLLCNTYEIKKYSIREFVKSRLRKLYFPYVIAYVFLAIVKIVFHSPFKYSKWYSLITELLCIQGIGIKGSGQVNYPMWYLSVLIIVSIVIYTMLTITPNRVFNITGTILIFIGIVMLTENTDLELFDYIHGIYQPVIRGITEMLIGVMLFRLPRIRINDAIPFVMVMILISMMFSEKTNDFMFLVIAAISVYFVVSAKFETIGNNIIVRKISEIELYMYLNHAMIIMLVTTISPALQINIAIEIIFLFATLIIWSSIFGILIKMCYKFSKKYTG